jgi:hypothetical protein
MRRRNMARDILNRVSFSDGRARPGFTLALQPA